MLSCESSYYVWSPFLGEFPEVIYERKENRNTEQDDSIPERSQSETSSTSVYQEPQSNEDLQNNDADCNLKDDSSSYDHKSNDQSKFVFLYYTSPHIVANYMLFPLVSLSNTTKCPVLWGFKKWMGCTVPSRKAVQF